MVGESEEETGESGELDVLRRRVEELENREKEFRRLVSENEAAYAVLKRSEEKYRSLTEELADTVWTLGMDMKPDYVSPSSVRVTGFIPEERMLGCIRISP